MSDSQSPSENLTRNKFGAIPVLITRIAPFLMPAILFQSAIFALVSPLPLFIVSLRNHSWISLLGLFTNAAFLYSIGVRSELPLAIIFWAVIGVFFPLFIRKTGQVPKSLGLSFFIFIAIALAGLWINARQAGLSPEEYVRFEISQGIDHLAAAPESPIQKLVEEEGRPALLKQIMTELPSGIAITILLALWLNLIFASQLVRGFLTRGFWANFKNPEWLLWPTIVSAALFAFGDHAIYLIGLNSFKVLAVLYGFQGLSILSHLLNHYKILGLGRTVIFSVAIFLMMPLVLSLGFFDLWFDFRRKFGQT